MRSPAIRSSRTTPSARRRCCGCSPSCCPISASTSSTRPWSRTATSMPARSASRTRMRIGFSVMIANNDQVARERMLDAAFWRIMNRLWPDQYIMNLIDTLQSAHRRGQSRQHHHRRHHARPAPVSCSARPRSHNETPVGELQYDVSIFGRTVWPPIITDDLERDPRRDRRQARRHARRDGSAPAGQARVPVRHFQATTDEKGESDMIATQRRRSRCAASASAIAWKRLRAASRRPASACVPRNDDMRRVLKHPTSGGFRASGGATGPNDRFTKRRLADGYASSGKTNRRPTNKHRNTAASPPKRRRRGLTNPPN